VRFTAPAGVVAGGVVAAIAMTVVFLVQEPATAEYLPPGRSVFLGAVLAVCLWVTVAPHRSAGTNRLAPIVGVATALACGAAGVVARLINTNPHLDPDLRDVLAPL